MGGIDMAFAVGARGRESCSLSHHLGQTLDSSEPVDTRRTTVGTERMPTLHGGHGGPGPHHTWLYAPVHAGVSQKARRTNTRGDTSSGKIRGGSLSPYGDILRTGHHGDRRSHGVDRTAVRHTSGDTRKDKTSDERE